MENHRLLVRALRGSQAHVLLAILLAGTALDVHHIQHWTGLKAETVRLALDGLRAVGLVAYQTLAHGRRLWLPAGDLLPLPQNTEKRTPVLGDSRGSGGSLPLNLKPPLPAQNTEKRTPVYDALRAAGVREPALSRLAALEHVTPELVAAHVEAARVEGKQLGAAIYRIEHNWPVLLDDEENRRERVLRSVERFMKRR